MDQELQESLWQAGLNPVWLKPQNVPPTLLPTVMERVEALENFALDSEMLLNDPRWEVRAAAIQNLFSKGIATPTDAVLTALNDEQSQVRAAAVQALGKMGRRAPLEYLLQASHDRDWEVREQAVLAFSALPLNRQMVRAVLQTALEDTHIAVREAATWGLQYSENTNPARPASARLLHFWQVFYQQTRVLRSHWSALALCMPLAYGLLLFFSLRLDRHVQDSASLLALLVCIASALGGAFIYSGQDDATMELTLSTPTSPRLILLSRFILLSSYNLLLAAATSTLLALLSGVDLWGIMQLWLGPMLLVASVAVSLSLLAGSWLALVGAMLLEWFEALHFSTLHQVIDLQFTHSTLWSTNPVVLGLAAFCIAFALLYAPRRQLYTQPNA